VRLPNVGLDISWESPPENRLPPAASHPRMRNRPRALWIHVSATVLEFYTLIGHRSMSVAPQRVAAKTQR